MSKGKVNVMKKKIISLVLVLVLAVSIGNVNKCAVKKYPKFLITSIASTAVINIIRSGG